MFRKRVPYLQHIIGFFVKANCGENRKITTNFLCDSTTHFLKNLPLVAFFILLFSSCHDEIPIIDAYENTNQTLFVYMPWTGTKNTSENNLKAYFDKNIAAMRQNIDQNKGVKQTDIIVFVAENQTRSVIFRMKYNTTRQRCELDTLKRNAGFVSVSESNLRNLFNQVVSYSNTGKYSLLIGCHGSGWTPRGSDSTMPKAMSRAFGGSDIDMQYNISDLRNAIAQSQMKKVSFICFDDCYMANVETAYALKDVTEMLVASTSEVMAEGIPYDKVFSYILGQTDYEKWVDGFYQFYINYKYPYGELSAIRCGKYIEEMASVMKSINQSYTFNNSRLNDLQFLDGYDSHVFFDLSSYIDELGVLPPLSVTFNQALQALVPYKACTPYIYTIYKNYYRHGDTTNSENTFKINKCCGITISDPTRNSTVYDTKQQSEWWKATH